MVVASKAENTEILSRESNPVTTVAELIEYLNSRRGGVVFKELIIWGPQVADEHDTFAELSGKDQAYLAKKLEGLDNKWEYH